MSANPNAMWRLSPLDLFNGVARHTRWPHAAIHMFAWLKSHFFCFLLLICARRQHAVRRNRKDLVTVSNLAASFAAVANCAIGSLSYACDL